MSWCDCGALDCRFCGPAQGMPTCEQCGKVLMTDEEAEVGQCLRCQNQVEREGENEPPEDWDGWLPCR